MKDSVEIKIITQGDAVCGSHGYMLKCSDNVAAFYLDGWGDTGRIYPVASSSSSYIDGKFQNFPSITIEDGQEESEYSEVCFPEFEGWNVHSISGGKSMSICLTKD